MPGGSIDYFLVGMKAAEILDYAGIEIQSLDTTGSGAIWKAREDLLQGRLRGAYSYGMNWKMSAKTILVQMHHKAAAFEALGKKLVLVVQKRFFDYITREFHTGQLRAADSRDSVHFHIYDVVMLGSELQIVLDERRSTNVSGVAQMLDLGSKGDILEEEVIMRIKAKMPNAVRLDVPPA